MESPERKADLAVRASRFLAAADAPIVDDVVILVADGRVSDVLPAASAWTAENTLDARDHLVTPGLVNAHTHLGLSQTRGMTHRGGEPIYDVFWPLETHLRPEDVEAFTEVAAAESLLRGITTVFEHYAFAEHAEAVVDRVGLRAWLGETVMTCDGPFTQGSLDRAIEHVERARPTDAVVSSLVAPHALDTIERPVLLELAELADAHHVPLHLHLAQSPRERAVIAERDGVSSVELAAEIGYLDRPALLAHCSYIDEQDARVLSRSSKVVVVYCPTVHAMDGMVQPASQLAAAGVTVAIGTDAPPSDAYDMIGETRGAVLGQRQRGRLYEPRDAFAAATLATGPMVGEPLLGRLAPGAPADLVCWDLAPPRMQLADDLLIALVMSPPPVSAVVVAGRLRVDEGTLVASELGALTERAVRRRDALLERSGL